MLRQQEFDIMNSEMNLRELHLSSVTTKLLVIWGSLSFFYKRISTKN